METRAVRTRLVPMRRVRRAGRVWLIRRRRRERARRSRTPPSRAHRQKSRARPRKSTLRGVRSRASRCEVATGFRRWPFSLGMWGQAPPAVRRSGAPLFCPCRSGLCGTASALPDESHPGFAPPDSRGRLSPHVIRWRLTFSARRLGLIVLDEE